MIVIWVMVLQLMVFINLTSRVRGFWAGKKIPSSIFIPTFHTFFFSSLFLFLHFNFCLLFNVFFFTGGFIASEPGVAKLYAKGILLINHEYYVTPRPRLRPLSSLHPSIPGHDPWDFFWPFLQQLGEAKPATLDPWKFLFGTF